MAVSALWSQLWVAQARQMGILTHPCDPAGIKGRTMVLYAVWVVTDQTFCYLDKDGRLTTKHKEAELFKSKNAAGQFGSKYFKCFYVEVITNKQEFLNREDTW